MKKLLILMLVLSISSVTYAGLTLVCDGEIQIDGTAVVQVVSDDTASYAAYVEQLEEYISGVVMLPAAGDDGYVNPFPEGYTDTYEISALDLAEPFNIQSGVQFEVTIDIAGSGLKDCDWILVTLYDGTWENVIAEQLIHVVPEPMTISLLGLGGLFLRRRK